MRKRTDEINGALKIFEIHVHTKKREINLKDSFDYFGLAELTLIS